MASKKPTEAAKQWQQTFVQCELDKSTKEQVKKWDVKYEATLDGLDRMINDGYKVSIAKDNYNGCVGVFCTMTDKNGPNRDLCLTSRGPGMLDALKVLVFKHFQVLQEHWDTEVNQERRRDTWG